MHLIEGDYLETNRDSFAVSIAITEIQSAIGQQKQQKDSAG